jgi:NADPH:quinone reductase-like Zn-dependent oxidoreductase
MKAVTQDRYGSAEVLRLADVDGPAVGQSQVLIEVRAASVNAVDAAVMRGMPYVLRLGFGLRRPRLGIRGSDVSGTVVRVGAGVSRFKVGDEVFGAAKGAIAELAVAGEGELAIKPEQLTFEQAAALPMAGLTALQGLRDVARIEPGQTVLINGASGGVGTFAVQIARALGADVTAVCGTRNIETARSIGANRVIDYTREDFTTAPGRFDVVFDNAASHSLSATRRLLKGRGMLIPNNGALSSRWLASLPRLLHAVVVFPFVRQRLGLFVSKVTTEDLEALAGMVEKGDVTPVIDRTYGLGDVPDAMAYVGEGHARGKVVITV